MGSQPGLEIPPLGAVHGFGGTGIGKLKLFEYYLLADVAEVIPIIF